MIKVIDHTKMCLLISMKSVYNYSGYYWYHNVILFVAVIDTLHQLLECWLVKVHVFPLLWITDLTYETYLTKKMPSHTAHLAHLNQVQIGSFFLTLLLENPT